jgi:hypothetical protein
MPPSDTFAVLAEDCWFGPVTSSLRMKGLRPDELVGLSQRFARRVELSGSSTAVTLEDGSEALEYYVLDGLELSVRCALLVEWYRDSLPTLASEVSGINVVPQESLRGAITLNRMEPGRSRYELHVDEARLTAVVYLTTHGPEDGGELTIYDGPRRTARRVTVWPTAGQLLLFDGRGRAHEIARVQGHVPRVSIVMNLWEESETQARPDGLDDYLYGPEA